MFEATKNNRVYQKALRHPQHEERDFCTDAQKNIDVLQLLKVAQDPHPEFSVDKLAPVGTSVYGGGVILKSIPGMGAVYDWRGTAWTRPMIEGNHNPILYVQHIPVIPQMVGIADFVRLRDVLVAQGLGVQTGTDGTGNVALFTEFNKMCYQARGANQFSVGNENMHYSIGDEWTKRQLRASAWLVNLAKEKEGIPAGMADLEPGGGIVRVARHGQTSHKMVSIMAGYKDRSDPGPLYDWEYVYYAVVKWRERIANGTADELGFEGI
jgi:hypothetical protein